MSASQAGAQAATPSRKMVAATPPPAPTPQPRPARRGTYQINLEEVNLSFINDTPGIGLGLERLFIPVEHVFGRRPSDTRWRFRIRDIRSTQITECAWITLYEIDELRRSRTAYPFRACLKAEFANWEIALDLLILRIQENEYLFTIRPTETDHENRSVCNGTPGEVVSPDVSSITCRTIEEVRVVFERWLYLEPNDLDFIDVTIAACLDREIEGDPAWLYAIAPPGGLKSEILGALGQGYAKAYTLDTLTTSTFISGLAEKDKESGEWVPVAGILQDLNNQTVVIKDFTTLLAKNEDQRTEIFGQLRSIYDGVYEQAFGTMRRKLTVRSKIGLVVGVTPMIDRYSKLQGALGERFLKIRSNPDKLKATRKALANDGKEVAMRAELKQAVKTFLDNLKFDAIPTISPEFDEFFLKIAYYTAFMRANTWKNYDESGRVIDAEVNATEVPTRLAKQFRHLAKLLAIVRGNSEVTEAGINTIRRVARDTSDPKRQAILDFMHKHGFHNSFTIPDISGSIEGIYRSSAPNHLQIMEALGIVVQAGDDQVSAWKVSENFSEYAEEAYEPKKNKADTTLPGVPLQIGQKSRRLDTYDKPDSATSPPLPLLNKPENGSDSQSPSLVTRLLRELAEAEEVGELWIQKYLMDNGLSRERAKEVEAGLADQGKIVRVRGGGWTLPRGDS